MRHIRTTRHVPARCAIWRAGHDYDEGLGRLCTGPLLENDRVGAWWRPSLWPQVRGLRGDKAILDAEAS